MELRIKEILKKKGATAVWLAGEIGITQPNMSNIVSGKSKPSLDTLENIATALNVPIAELFEQTAQDVISCPHCGGKIKIVKE
ncbi:transcriptional regulator with XRE-family HTH domain [Parabacteroides sp. PFB2-12]|uniref:helix-turn-helix domain-containing protein n=1 Tax=unclassified Parabacteroides TaxID=2649774 RepID=UPI0024735435|nr:MULTISPECIES: helix-turn-helix transcriptional regulator [unclassified Parabacteroides]MDH6343336.1 transcriptional regulator with XRE-family HTH domain [Parabacteroides sp. PM6-13]MDH6390352.1 transcriptional regulator with XRE-family HTH domain [Parabacteroides sp. PFB2-12]